VNYFNLKKEDKGKLPQLDIDAKIEDLLERWQLKQSSKIQVITD